MTSKEAIIHSLDKTTDDIEILPIAFSEFLLNMSILICATCDRLLSMDFPTVEIDGEKIDGSAKEQSSFHDILQVLNANDMLRHTNLFIQVHGFIGWFLDQEAVVNEETNWFGLDVLSKRWNEYAQIKR